MRSTMRSIAAAQRRAERDAKRRQRELERQQKELEWMEERERASYEVEVYDNYLAVLVSVHKDCGLRWDWEKTAKSNPPKEPAPKFLHEDGAKRDLKEYKPGISDKLLRRVDKKQNDLKQAIEDAKHIDEKEYQDAIAKYSADYTEWKELKELAHKVNLGDTDAYETVVNKIDPFSEISALGSSIHFHCDDSDVIEVTLHTHGEDVIPKEQKTLLKSGRLSVKNLPKTRFYELYQDYVCGATLRVARELFALLPIDMQIITSMASLLNTSTGHMEEQPILSVAIPRKTIQGLEFDHLDPSDSLTNFVHNMNFKKTKGFAAVDKIIASNLQSGV